MHFADGCGGNAELYAVFHHGASCDFYAASFELLCDLAVGEWVLSIFGVDDLLEHRLDRVPRNIFAVTVFCATCEEVAESYESSR